MRIAPIVMIWREGEFTDPRSGEVVRLKAMVPVERYRKSAYRMYHDDGEYPMGVIEARSRAAHSGYFAQLNEAYQNLPENIAVRWQTSEHFRKWLLIETGWFNEKEFTFEGRSAEREAKRLATFIQTEDEHARVTISRIAPADDSREVALDKAVEAWTNNGALDLRQRLRMSIRAALSVLDRGGKWIVLVRKAKSQDHAHMGKEDFKASSDAVLELAAHFVSVTPRELRQHARRAS